MEEVNNRDVGARPADATDDRGDNGLPTAAAMTEGYDPLEAEEETAEEGLYPPDVDPTIDIGGSPEEQAALREEYRQP
jgi:hypothetical protein